MGEIRFVGTGGTCGYPYLVCKKFLSVASLTSRILFYIRKILCSLDRNYFSFFVESVLRVCKEAIG